MVVFVGYLAGNMRRAGDISYSQLRSLFTEEKVQSFAIENERLTASLRDGTTATCELYSFETFYEDLNDLVVEQNKAGIIEAYDYHADHSTNWVEVLLPYVLAIMGFILLLNLMPTKIVTETQLARLLANSPLQVQLTFLQTKTHDTTHTPQEHMKAFYKTFDAVRNERFDGMIITGAPIEDLDYEDVDYWNELCEIMDYSRENVYSTIHLCWGALAGLYYHFGVRKVHLPEKMFGVFEHRVVRPSNPLVRGFDEIFYAPHSRWAGLNRADIDAAPELRMLAESDVAGPMLLSTESGRQIFVIGHPEYDKYTLDAEYRRDVKAGKEIHVPVNYYPDDDPNKDPIFRWRAHAHLLYTNWLNYYVYQNTPYDLDDLEAVVDPPRT